MIIFFTDTKTVAIFCRYITPIPKHYIFRNHRICFSFQILFNKFEFVATRHVSASKFTENTFPPSPSRWESLQIFSDPDLSCISPKRIYGGKDRKMRAKRREKERERCYLSVLSTGAVLNRIFIFVVSNPSISGRC